jgi:glycosyltransferase involved in cell wall biosynthesis
MGSCEAVPSIAVVIPVYNGEAYIAEAIESALAQAHRPSEIIILDDASSDGTDAVISRYRGHPLIRTHRLASRVPAPAAWNRVVRLSTAEYFVVLAHDDRLHRRFLGEVAKVLAASPGTGLVVTGYDLIDAAGNVVEGRPIRQSNLVGRTPFDVFFNELVVRRGMYFQPTCAVVARAAFESVNGFDERFYAAYDFDFYIRLAAEGTVCGLGQPLVDYRMHAANTSTAVFHEDCGDCDVIFRKLESYARLSERQKRQLARNVSLFQFHYVTRAIRSRRFSPADVDAIRKQVKARLAGWANTGSPYSRDVRRRPSRLRQLLAWQASAHSTGVALIRIALLFSSRLRAACEAARREAGGHLFAWKEKSRPEAAFPTSGG